MTIDVNPTTHTPTHHVSLHELENESNKYGLIVVGGVNGISRRPRQNSQHTPFTKNDWSGGRGLKFAIEDRTRFADSKRLNTRRSGIVSLGGLETYTRGFRKLEQFLPQDADGMTWQSLTGSNRFIAYKLTASATGNRARLYFWVRRRGNPGPLSARLKSNNAGDPGTELKLVQVDTDDITDTLSMLYEFTFSSVYAVTATTDYWAEISGDATDNTADHWEVGVDATRTNALTKISAAGSTWGNPTFDLYFRLVDDLDIAGAKFFIYKSQLYALTRPNGSVAPKLFMNGYRGVATGSGAGWQTRGTLTDTTKNWSTNELAGALIMIIDGPNSEWTQPYRTISGNNAATITFPDFGKVNIEAQTAYVILGGNLPWTEITGHGLTVLPTDVAVAGDTVYFAQGDGVKMRRMQEQNVAGVWTRSFAEEDNYAKLLLVYKDGTRGLMVMKGNDYDNSNRPSVAKAKAEAWGTRLKFPWLLDPCESTLLANWTGGTGTTVTADGSLYQTGSASIKAAITNGANNVFLYRTFSPAISLFFQRKLRFWVYVSFAIDKGMVKLRLSQANNGSTSLTDIDLPALDSGVWTQVEIPYRDRDLPGVGEIQSIAFIKTFAASLNFYVDGLEAVPDGSEIQLGNDTERITGLELYGDPEVPWILRTGSIGWEANGVFTPVPLREYSQVENPHNGVGHLVHDVYLYFSFLQGIEEYYRANIDDIGPNRDEGLPADRQGYVTSMVGYPDRFLYNYDAGLSGHSSIMTRKGGGHHEEYRCDAAGKRIRSLIVQVIPGDMADRLWFCEGEDIVWLPLPGNTVNELTDPTYRFTHEGVLQEARIGDDQQRLFSYVKLGLENVSAARCIEWDYRIDDATDWTPMATKFTTGPVQTLALNKTGKRLELRFRMQTDDSTQTPRIISMFVSTTEQNDVRYAYSMTFKYMDNGRDLLANLENYTRAEVLISQLDTWASNKTPLVMRSQSETYDNRIVYLDPTPTGPTGIVPAEQQEEQQGTLTVTEPL